MSSLDKYLTLDVARVTEAAALAAYHWIGRGDSMAADKAAVEAMRHAMDSLPISGTIVIGEGERDKAPMLFIGEEVGDGYGEAMDIAVDPLECTTLCATGAANSLSVMALAHAGNFLHAPDVYMEKIAVGIEADEQIVSLDAPLKENLRNLALAKGCEMNALGVMILERPRHEELIAVAREAGVRVYLIPDGDVAAIIATALPDTGIDMYIGTGGAPEGVLAAAALRSLGGQMQARLIFPNAEQEKRAHAMGVSNIDKLYHADELAAGDVIFAATGVTDGWLLKGVKHKGFHATTESLVMRSKTGTIRRITAEHNLKRKHWVR